MARSVADVAILLNALGEDWRQPVRAGEQPL